MSERYRVLYVDPPWFYADRKKERKDNAAGETRFGIGAQGHYSAGCMTDRDLLEMAPLIQAVTLPDAYMFMWATSPRLDFAIQLGEAWGFRYITQAFVWVKTTSVQMLPFFGAGAYTGSNVEPVLLFRRGSKSTRCWHPNGGGAFKPPQVLLACHPRDQRGKKIHSRKPAQIQEWLEQWLGDVPRAELFATVSRHGWRSLGHALSGMDIREQMAWIATITTLVPACPTSWI
jgi:N6-adenosine-specific RNA methylase IME4